MPFTRAEFLEVFARYHGAVGPAPVIAFVLAVVVIVSSFARPGAHVRLVSLLLATLWIWAGIVYHLHFFAPINPVARLFAAMFVLQAGLFLWEGVVRQRLSIQPATGSMESRVLGSLIVFYAMVGYPLVGLLVGHTYPRSATFGLPCPTVIYTLGVLVWARRPWPLSLVVIPAVWALIGAVGAAQLGMWEDFGLPAASTVVVLVLLRSRPTGIPTPGSVRLRRA